MRKTVRERGIKTIEIKSATFFNYTFFLQCTIQKITLNLTIQKLSQAVRGMLYCKVICQTWLRVYGRRLEAGTAVELMA